MLLNDRWQELNQSDWETLARDWFNQYRGVAIGRNHSRSRSVAEEIVRMNLTPAGRERSGDHDAASHVLIMTITAAPDIQWNFIRVAVAVAKTDEDLCHIAVGPMACLLDHHGGDHVDAVEVQAAADPKFARMLREVCKYGTSDKVWDRFQTIKARHAATDAGFDDLPLRIWPSTACRALATAVARCVREHVSASHSRAIDFYGYALVVNDRYDARRVMATSNADADIPVDVSDSRYHYYRYCVDEWQHFSDEGFESVNTLLAEARALHD